LDHYLDFYKKELTALGYKNVFLRKNNSKHDGCLIGVKRDRLDIMESVELDMNLNHEYEKEPDFQRGSVALLAKIRDIRDPKITLSVVCTHIFWDPKFEHVKYLQMSLICKLLENTVKETDNLVVCGDFNSTPNTNVVNLLMTKGIPVLQSTESQSEKGLDVMKKVHLGLDSFLKKFEFDNTYRHYGQVVDQAEEYPAYTNYTHDFKGTLDHIFFSKNRFEVKGLLGIPKPHEIIGKTLPNEEHPSDHLPIVGILELKKDTL